MGGIFLDIQTNSAQNLHNQSIKEKNREFIFMKSATVGDILIGEKQPFTLIAGPCVIESEALVMETAAFLKELTDRLKIPFIFKSSFDKANRTSITSFRGPGLEKGLNILNTVKQSLDIKVTSDVHTPEQVQPAAEVLDLLQTPAFLCRQTDFIVSAAEAQVPLNIKKGQFLAPQDMENVVKKAHSTGNKNILVTERGTMFGYNNLVVDYAGIPTMQRLGIPVVFDATHSVQRPGGKGSQSGGDRTLAPTMAKAAVAAGADALFIEVHPDPDKALCDGPNSLALKTVEPLLTELLAISRAIGRTAMGST